MPDFTGIDLVKRLNELNVDIPVIVVTGDSDVPLAIEAMKLGAADFFEKPFDGDTVVAAVRNVLSGPGRDLDREAAKIAAQERIASLLPRERDVLAGLAAGYPGKTIASNLGISASVVEVHRANMMSKMNAASLSQVVRMAWLAGLPTGEMPPKIDDAG
jgi:two-component system response regulator FixJ